MFALTDGINGANFDPKLARLAQTKLFRERPDVMRVRHVNGEYWLDAIEYGSAGQTEAFLLAKLNQGLLAVKAALAQKGVVLNAGTIRAFEKGSY